MRLSNSKIGHLITRHSTDCGILRPQLGRAGCMAWLRRIGTRLCGRGRTATKHDYIVLVPRQRAIVVSLELSDRNRSLTIAAIDRVHIHWLDLGRTRSPPKSTWSAPLSGTVERASALGRAVEARLTSVRHANIQPAEIYAAALHGSDLPDVTSPGHILEWLLALPRAADPPFEWIDCLEALLDINVPTAYRIAIAAVGCAVRASQLTAVCRFVARKERTRLYLPFERVFRESFARALERVSEFADVCDTASLPDDQVVDETLQMVVATRPHMVHFASALIMGGNAKAACLGWISTGAVLDAARGAMEHRRNLILLFLACTTLPSPLVRLVCELAFALPDSAAEALCAPNYPAEIRRTSAFPQKSFAVGSSVVLQHDGVPVKVAHEAECATFAFSDGTAAHLCLTISPAGASELRCQRDYSGVFVVDLRPHRHPSPWRVSSWSEEYGLLMRDHLNSLFDDSPENRMRFIVQQIQETCRGRDDLVLARSRVAQLLARFGADDVAAAAAELDWSGLKCGALASVLALGVPPTHPEFRELPWCQVRSAFDAHTASRSAALSQVASQCQSDS